MAALGKKGFISSSHRPESDGLEFHQFLPSSALPFARSCLFNLLN
jgi:hypothetical protein